MFDSSVHASFDFCTCNFLRQTVMKDTIKCTEAWLLFTCPISFSGGTTPQQLILKVIAFLSKLLKNILIKKHDVICGFFSLINAKIVYSVCFLWACIWICKQSIKYGPEKPILSLLAIFQQHIFV